MLKLKQYLQNPQEHSVVLFARNPSEETSENKFPNLGDLSRKEVDDDMGSDPPGSPPGFPPGFFPPGDDGGNPPNDGDQPPQDGDWWQPS